MSARNFSIGTRLAVGFALVLVLVIIIAGTGLYGMSQMEGDLEVIHNENSVKLKQANLSFQNMNSLSWAMRLVPFTSGTPAFASVQEQVLQSRERYRAAMTNLEKMETSSEGKGIIAGIKAAIGEVVGINDQVLQLAQSGRKEEALSLQKSKADPMTAKVREAFEALLKYEEKSSKSKFEEAQAAFVTDRSVMISMSLTALLLSIVIAVVLTKGITAPLAEAVSFAHSIAEGDLTARCRYRGKDEPGRLVAALNTMAEGLTRLVSNVTEVSRSVSLASDELQATAERIATGTEEVACQTGVVATASEEMSATSGDIARNCLQAAQTCNKVGSAAHGSAQVVQESISSMGSISEKMKESAANIDALGTRSNQIGEIVKTIGDIADQTNLLALNAAIEAARAGDQGMGFAVVAGEVRALAERTATATREISDMIKSFQQETSRVVATMEDGMAEVERGSVASEKSGQALEEILAQIGEVTMQVNVIATAAEEQTATTAEITSNMQQVSDVVQEAARGAGETSAAAAELASQSAAMQTMVKHFRFA